MENLEHNSQPLKQGLVGSSLLLFSCFRSMQKFCKFFENFYKNRYSRAGTAIKHFNKYYCCNALAVTKTIFTLH